MVAACPHAAPHISIIGATKHALHRRAASRSNSLFSSPTPLWHMVPLSRTAGIVGRVSHLPPGRLALELTTAGETPDEAGETPAPLLGGGSR